VGGTSSDGALIERSTDGGSTFTLDTVPTGSPDMLSVDCVGTLNCVAVGTSDAMVSEDGGVTWTLHPTPASTLQSVSCENTADCTAVGGVSAGKAVYSTDGGKSWTLSSVPPATASGVTCTASTCIVAGESPYVSVNGGQTWSAKTVSGGSDGYFSASCTTDGATCLAIGTNTAGGTNPGDLGLSTDGGSTWTNEDVRLPASSASFQAVSCWNTSDCMAIGPDPATTDPFSIIGSVTQNSGTSFGPLFQPGTGSVSLHLVSGVPVFGFTCSASGRCIVAASNSAGAVAYTSSDDGATWTASSIQ
jgi:hypothetical protein